MLHQLQLLRNGFHEAQIPSRKVNKMKLVIGTFFSTHFNKCHSIDVALRYFSFLPILIKDISKRNINGCIFSYFIECLIEGGNLCLL